MAATWYPTRSGRRVLLEQLHVERFALGVSEGRPETIRARKLAALPDRLRTLFPGRTGYLILDPPPATEVAYPAWVVAARLHSTEPVGRDADCSALAVAWFAGELPADLPALLRETLQGVAWEAHAVDGHY